jgi:hypothetical protein
MLPASVRSAFVNKFDVSTQIKNRAFWWSRLNFKTQGHWRVTWEWQNSDEYLNHFPT